MTDALGIPTNGTPSRTVSAAAVEEIFDYLEDFFVFCDAFAPQLSPLQRLVYQRFQATTKAFRHDLRVATYGAQHAFRGSL